jgi:hypothetical protein
MLEISKPRKRGKKSEYYVNPDIFEELIAESYRTDILSDEVCICVDKIANKLSYSPNFINYSYRDEMVGDAREKMIATIRNKVYKYDPGKVGKNGKKGNAFMYFTKVAFHAMVNRIKIEKKERDAVENYRDEIYNRLMDEQENGQHTRRHTCYDEENTWN